MEENQNKQQSSDEDTLLDPLARSILRDLQSSNNEAISSSSQPRRDLSHDVVIIDENTIQVDGDVIRCDEKELTENELIHCKAALELNQNDGSGYQGGQGWKDPTSSPIHSPTASPTTGYPTTSPSLAPVKSSAPTGSPTWHPTALVEAWKLAGTVYYDRNANGERDSNVDTLDRGKDVEWNIGLGGVNVQLMECNPDDNEVLGWEAQAEKYGEGDNSYASTVSVGYDVLMHPKLTARNEMGGKFTLTGIKVDRCYFVQVQAPLGYLLSGGVCNDAKPGWGCDHSSPEALAADQEEDRPSRYRRAKQEGLVATTWRGHLLRGSGGSSGENASSTSMEGKRAPRYLQQARPDRPGGVSTDPAAPDDVGYEYTPPTESELELGISEGRSAKCICVDRAGKPQGHLDIGAMKVGDVDFQETEVELNLKLLDPSVHGKDGRNLLLEALLLRGRSRALQREGGSSGQLNFFSLDQKDKDAIGTVTAEVIAINLDTSMKKKGVVLDSVAHIDVLFTPDEPEPEEEIVPEEDAVADGSSASGTHSKGGEVAARDPDSRGEAGSAKRDRGGGKLSVSLLVRGHHNRNLNVDFDFIVQDSINRDTHNIRRQLTHYNSNCRDQTAKVMDEGYTLDDFLEIHTNRGVEKPVNLDRRQQQQQATDEDAFSSACNQNQILPEYFEQSLGGIQVESAEDSYTVDDGGASPWAIVGGIVAAGVLAIIGAGFLFRRALKKKQAKAQEARVTHLVVDDGVGGVDAKDPKNAELTKEKGGGKSGKGSRGIAYALPGEDAEPSTVQETFQRRGIAGVFSREIGNVRAALTSERSRMARNGSRRKDSTGGTHGDSIQSGSGTGSGTHSDRNLSDLADHVDEQAEQGNRPNRSGLSRRPSQDDLTVGIRRHASDGAAQDELRRSRCDMDIPDGRRLSSNNNSDPGAGDMDEEEGGDQFEASGLAMNLGVLDRLSSAANNNSRGGDASVAVSVTPSMVSCNSRNAAPKIVKVDFLESDSEEDEEEESSDDDSSDESSSDDDNSSDSDSSSSDDSDASSHHKKRGPTRRTTAGSMDMSAKSGRSTRSGKSGASMDKSGKSVKSSKSGSGSKVSSKKKMKGENKKKTTKEEAAKKKRKSSKKAKDARPSRRSSDPSERDTGIRRHNPGEGGRRSSNYL